MALPQWVTDAFAPAPGYLNAPTMGLPPRAVVEAMRRGLSDWQQGIASPLAYDESVIRARRDYARLVDAPVSAVAVGPSVSVFAGVVAASLPDGTRVLAVEDDFTSILFPFLVQAGRHRGVQVEMVSLAALPTAIDDATDLVVFSLAQSSTGEVVDLEGVRAAARRCGALTFCDVTQAAGWYPVRASGFDFTVCASYKWLCQPRGAAYLTVGPEGRDRLIPVNAGWYAGESVWESVYGPQMHLAADARRFDVSPSWLTWVGAAAAGEVFRHVDVAELGAHGVGLANDLRARLDMPPRATPVVAIQDPDGRRAAACAEAGATVASRAGLVRVGFHLWNTPDDVELVDGALR
ncbi:MAG TPA: aminotransferase class V-fold PLP-dependent enzyme [Ornithinimicrobium sp.]|uniref:aminotransferase class V-fold PLP-dependent enzyme n=1 Tax=Ornithinimicrobium sp. TaxID=1977084 RepID=UPI002B492321|nr:aminotransferase class V-fold PLP-dependent enzyme [Ornithinimicrobium sp.]HKJ12557.1 aminotransferase class V-fold PLP-dependent enzyme [Ornithinimicrobium sp.]